MAYYLPVCPPVRLSFRPLQSLHNAHLKFSRHRHCLYIVRNNRRTGIDDVISTNQSIVTIESCSLFLSLFQIIRCTNIALVKVTVITQQIKARLAEDTERRLKGLPVG